ncbi:putative aldehyde oxidase 2 [Triticum urartu]|uniref:Putative aldehyde oxidase 2 n=1 Tax=Triticum urartu TaxID=4572 RepID=M7ZER3_TRIUA|nr:putative aldehyde oxidase 2 [Triticum urartu]
MHAGGCGACVVLISKYDPATDEVTEFSASSCLTLVGSLNHCSVTTSEGIGNTRDGYHPVQQRLAGFHASQCGFCTPGMCMSIFSSLVKADKPGTTTAGDHAPPPGFSKLTCSKAEHAVSGNLCRCTGYRPILDACKSFAADVDLEDLGLNSFWKKGTDSADISKLPEYSSGSVCTFPEFLKSEIKGQMNENSVPAAIAGEDGWYHPRSIQELHSLFDSSWFDENSVKIVASNTGAGVYKDQDLYDKYIDIKGIAELSVIDRNSKGLEIGAAVSISKAIEVFSDGTPVFRKIASHLSKVASPFVRNTATVGGNVIMAQRLQFPSDIATVLLAAGSTVTIQTASKMLCLTLDEFLEQPPCDAKTILLSIFVPDWGSDNVIFETSRVAPRPFGNAVSYVNSAFLARTSGDGASGKLIIEDICLAFGAYGVDHTTQARKVEEFLKGKSVSAPVILEAVRLLKDIIMPSEGTTHPEYRVSLAVSFLFSFLSSLGNNLTEPAKAIAPNGSCANGSMNGQVASEDLQIRSRQELVFNDEYKPVGKPITKSGAELQASGEAVYVDDIPAPQDCLYGAFIYSTHPHAHIKGVNFRPSLASEKVIGVITAKDIPAGGKNVGAGINMLGTEALFGDPVSEFAGQNIGIVIAETQKYAYMAAKQAVIEYSTENLQPPILTIEDAIRHNSYFQTSPYFAPRPVGDFEQGMSQADHKILSGEVACACAVAAFKLRRPVRMYLDRKTDMIMAGGRHPMKAKYSVGFKSDGTLTALHVDLGINAGISPDLSPMIPAATIASLKKYNWGALAFDIKLCKTNVSSKSAVRAPGDVQGSFIAEAIIEHVASALGADTNAVGGVELGQGLYTKVKQMTAFGLRELCPDADGLLDKVRVIQADTLSLIQGSFTGGSTTSESSCEAVRQSCAVLVERLQPIKEGLEAKSGAAAPWSALIAQAKMASVNLSAHAYWKPDPAFVKYINYGAAVSEVEIDVLTGATTIMRSDLVYDCGQSLTPAVDLGQVEGAFVQGVGFFTNEDYATNADGLVVHDGTWTYKIPTVDTIPKQFNVELISSARENKRGPPLLLAASVHCAMREAIRAARTDFSVNSPLTFQMDVPATMADVKELCGLDVVERHLQSLSSAAEVPTPVA